MPLPRQIRTRQYSLRAVIAVLSIQLVFTFFSICAFVYSKVNDGELSAFVIDIDKEILNGAFKTLCFVLFVISYLAILYSDCENSCNILCLATMTAGLTYFAVYNIMVNDEKRETFLGAFTVMTLLCAIIFFAAIHMKIDLTRYHTVMMFLAFAAVVSFFSLKYLIFLFSPGVAFYMKVTIVIVLILFCAFDVQTFMGEKYLMINAYDVIYAAARLYFDIMWILLVAAYSIIEQNFWFPE